MDRRNRRPDNVSVYARSTDRQNDIEPIKTVKVVPYSIFGLDYYLVDDAVYPGYVHGDDACVFLDRPMPNNLARTTT
ncbi:hypothetical protein H4CHR_02946 [Variovorax sp. PBS-H4]|uniref:hypothetical protein n=1 Tax=Variovorax sp. PBS-H4 TaxID=434008 RepID=UPI001317CA0F|nr:hypothetical protein [Variovorax sp. PBS-H4]VTU32118.1 hypothetical protein H4CHR_02946 [Variovorax sp. PBS-H4]